MGQTCVRDRAELVDTHEQPRQDPADQLHLTDHEDALVVSGVAPERLPGLTKDLHLVVAALEHGDNIVISNDRRAARGFKGLSHVIEEYGAVSWWNTDHPIPPGPRNEHSPPSISV